MSMFGLGAGIGALGGLLGAFGGSKTKGSNINDIVARLMEFGYGTPSKYGPDTQSLFDVIKGTQGRDLSTLNFLKNFNAASGAIGNVDLLRLLNSTTQAAQGTRTSALAGLNGAYDTMKTSLSRDLGTTIQGIFKTADANAAGRGIKSEATTSKAAGQATIQANSVYDMLAKLGMTHAEDVSGINERTGTNLTNTLNQLGQFKFNATQGLRQSYSDQVLKLLGLTQQTERAPAQTLLDTVRALPVTQGYQAPNFTSQIGAGIGAIGGGITGIANANQNEQLMDMLKKLLG